eukprot:512088-Pleurochrysis_carterae.AAC.4
MQKAGTRSRARGSRTRRYCYCLSYLLFKRPRTSSTTGCSSFDSESCVVCQQRCVRTNAAYIAWKDCQQQLDCARRRRLESARLRVLAGS